MLEVKSKVHMLKKVWEKEKRLKLEVGFFVMKMKLHQQLRLAFPYLIDGAVIYHHHQYQCQRNYLPPPGIDDLVEEIINLMRVVYLLFRCYC